MADQHTTMITDYFHISNRINEYTQEQNIEEWDIDLIKIRFISESNVSEFNDKELALLLSASESQIHNFFVVHCCLSNYLNELIDDQKYSSWFVQNEKLNISYANGNTKYYDAADIALLMKKTEKADWSYPALVASSNAMF